ncbi:MAG: hypothetical protein JWP91_838, partial [Fibrobacteres bacterium]|nr:hypothetical protein [Fibrobacterota bacterium]
ATAAAAAATTAGTLFSFVDLELTSVELSSIELLDRRGRSLVGSHGDEREAAGTASFAIGGDGDFADFTNGRKDLLKGFLRGVEGKISYVETITHRSNAFFASC